MKVRRPPAIPTHFLKYFCFRPEDDAVVGDLMERYARGGTAWWYWRQAAGIVVSALKRRMMDRVPDLRARIFSEDGLVLLVGAGALAAAGPFALVVIPAAIMIWLVKVLGWGPGGFQEKNVAPPPEGPATASINSARIAIGGGLGAGFLILILLSGVLLDLPRLRTLALAGLLSGLAYAAFLHWWRNAYPRDPQRDWISIGPKQKNF